MQLIYCFFLLFLFWIAVKAFRAQDEEKTIDEEEPEEQSYSEISDTINDLNDHKNKIDEINDIISDIRSCAPGKVHKTVSVRILENDHKINFDLNGTNYTSEMLIQILENERDTLASSLRKLMKKF